MYRSLLDVVDLVRIVEYCKNKIVNNYVNISFIEKKPVNWFINEISKIISIEPNVKYIYNKDKENNWNFDNSYIVELAIKHLGIKENNYTKNVIRKYIGV